jgi:hypothetical protein
MSIPISHICTEQDKKHFLAFLLLAISTHAASYTRQTFLTLILIKKKGKELHELHPKPIASFFMLAPPSSCISLEPADLQHAMAMRTDAWFENRLIAHESSRRERQTASLGSKDQKAPRIFLTRQLKMCNCCSFVYVRQVL